MNDIESEVRLLTANGWSAGRIAESIGIAERSVVRIRARLRAEDRLIAPPTPSESLGAEVERLRKENTWLKKRLKQLT